MCKLIRSKSETLSFILASEYVNQTWQQDLNQEMKRLGVVPAARESH